MSKKCEKLLHEQIWRLSFFGGYVAKNAEQAERVLALLGPLALIGCRRCSLPQNSP
jgi:hypothetical protein